MIIGSVVAAGPVAARLPAQAPPLPPPDPGDYDIVHVDTAQALANACWNLSSNRAIVIAPGVYDLSAVSFPNGVDGRLTVGRFGATPISNIQIRGATDDAADVVIHGAGMLDPQVPYGFHLFTSHDVTIANLSVGEVYYHAIGIDGPQGARNVRLYNIRAFDAGQQIIKGSGVGADDVIIEYVEVYYTVGAIVHPQGSPPNTCYTNGIDVTGGHRWIIRDSLIERIRCQNNALAGPAILVWQGASDTLVERNTILDSSRGISLGLVDSGDHFGGIIRNNRIRWNPSATFAVDVPIYTTSPDARILHNTALTRGRYANAIEVRFVGATDVEVAHNLSDAAILPRNGAVPILTDNETGAQPSWFQNEADADLRLTPGAVAAIAQVSRRNDSPDDFEGLIRHAPRDCPHSARTNMRRSASFSTASSRFPAVARAPAHRTTVRLAAALRRGTIATSHPARTACQARPALQPSAARFSNR